MKRLLGKSLARRNLVSYEVAATAPDEARAEEARNEKRSSARRRVRLRSGKLLDQNNKFLSECLMRDQSAQGVRLDLARNVGVPARCHLYDDETGAIDCVDTMWRRGGSVGMRYRPLSKPIAIRDSDLASLRDRYYAIAD